MPFFVNYDEIESVRHAESEVFEHVIVENDIFNSFEVLGDTERPPYLLIKSKLKLPIK